MPMLHTPYPPRTPTYPVLSTVIAGVFKGEDR